MLGNIQIVCRRGFSIANLNAVYPVSCVLRKFEANRFLAIFFERCLLDPGFCALLIDIMATKTMSAAKVPLRH